MSTSHVYHHVKFRWTENLTCRFIQLRKEHGKMFTGRKYSAQSGWEYILRQMREEFPTIMADVHYRVLKKKWSNLLQQYKELKNPVHGDKNKADDISWPFYAAIDEVLGNLACTPRLRRRASSSNDQENLEDDDDLNPQEFLCVSVEPDIDDEDEEPLVNPLDLDYHHHQHQDELDDKVPGLLRLQPIKLEEENRAESTGGVFDIDTLSRTTRRSTMTSRKRSAPTTKTNENSSSSLLSRLPRTTELTIRPIRRTGPTSICSPIGGAARVPPLEPIVSLNGETNRAALDNILRGVEENENENENEEEKEKDEVEEENSRPRKSGRRNENSSGSTATADGENCEMGRLERRFVEFFEYTKCRDEENRSILMRMLKAIEDIRNSVG